MRLLLPDRPEARELDLPDGVERAFYDASEPLGAAQLDGVEFVVLDPPVADGTVDAVIAADSVRVVQTMSAGVDFIAGKLRPGVTLCDAAGVHDTSVAEWVAAVLFGFAKRIPDFLGAEADGEWRPLAVEDVEGMTVLILGHGSIGRKVEECLAPFGVNFVRVARRARDGVHAIGELPELIGEADAVVVLVPLTDETRGLVDSATLAALKPGAMLINAARGPVVDTAALVEALRGRRIRAALDVTDPEPLPPGHPLWSAPNLILTPHVAGDVPNFPQRAMALISDQVRRHVAGEPLNNVVSDGY